MPYLGLDSVAENFTPQQIVNDMRSVNAKLIGLYVFNNDVPNASAVVKTGPFVQQLETLYGGPCVLPIITIRSGDSPNPAFLVQDLLKWFPQGKRRVAHDLETTALPPLSEMAALFAAEKAAGFSPGIYGFQSVQSTYVSALPDWQWGVQAYAEGFGYLPGPYSMWQWTDNVLNYTYDGNTVDDAFSVVTQTYQPPIVTTAPEEAMRQRMIYDPAADQQHFVYLVPAGAGQAQLYYRYWDNKVRVMSPPVAIQSAPLDDSSGLDVTVMDAQLHAFARWADTSAATGAHFWMQLPAPNAWSSQNI